MGHRIFMMKWTIALIALVSSNCSAVDEPKNPVEVGSVEWKRNYPEALKTSKTSDKPLLILFQEVPG